MFYPMLPSSAAMVQSDLKRAVDHGRATAEVALLEGTDFPKKGCRYCFGGGAYIVRDGVRMSVSNAVKPGDEWHGSCPKCRGFGWIRITELEAKHLAKKRMRKLRGEYRTIRSAVCADRDFTTDHFDRMATKHVAPTKTPSDWIKAARAVADMFGTKIAKVA